MSSSPSSSASCNLKCQNGGECSTELGDGSGSLSSLSLSSLSATTFFCRCPEGFVGPLCQYKAQVCGSNEKICLHGSECVRTTTTTVSFNTTGPNNNSNNSSNDDSDSGTYRCECPTNTTSANDETNETSSSSSCPKQRTEFCLPQEGHVEYYGGMAVPVFCVNDGKCSDVEIDGIIHAKCICPPLYTGPHCEFLKADSTNSGSSSSNQNTSGISFGGLIVLLLLFVLSLSILVMFVVRQLRRRNRERDGPTIDNIQGFRDEIDYDDDENNINNNNNNFHSNDNNFNIAMSPNGSMLFPAFITPQESSSSMSTTKRKTRPKRSNNAGRNHGGIFS